MLPFILFSAVCQYCFLSLIYFPQLPLESLNSRGFLTKQQTGHTTSMRDMASTASNIGKRGSGDYTVSRIDQPLPDATEASTDSPSGSTDISTSSASS